jgi:hypothetical protein
MLKSRGSFLLLFGLIFSAAIVPRSQLSIFAHPLPTPSFFLPPGGLPAAKPDDPAAFEVYRGRAPQGVSMLPGEFLFGSSSAQRVKKKVSRQAAAASGNAGGKFLDAPEYAAGAGADSVAVGDINGDGKQDLAVANFNDNTVSILLGNGDGSFAAHRDYPTGKGPSSVALADVNGDGKLDVIVANATDNTVSILEGNGDGTFLPHVDFPAGIGPTSLVVADFNGDKKPDLAVVNPQNSSNSGMGTISVLIGNGNGTFQAPVSYPTAYPVAVATGDLNGDGKADLVVANNQNPGEPGPGSASSLTILLGKGDGSFQPGVVYMLNLLGPLSVAIADLNDDGVPDLITPTTDLIDIPGPGSVTVLLGNGDGSFKNPVAIPTGHAGDYSTAHITAGDFDGDGHMDVAISSSSENTVSVLLGKGDGSFRSESTFGTGSSPFSVVAGDLNGDGQLDLVTPNSMNNSASVLLGNGDGTFQARAAYSVGDNPAAIATEDFNGDGKADLVTADLYDGTSVLLGNGNGTFQQNAVYPAGGITYAIVVGDFNGDNKPDLATANAANSTVSVLLGNGDGTFQTNVDYPIANQPDPLRGGSIVTADFNGDGALDLAVAGGGHVCLLLNTGVGTFQAFVDLGITAQWLVSADFNGDGKADLAIAVGTQVAVLLGNGDGTFQVPMKVNVPGGVLAAGDFNGDGKADLVVFQNGISVLLGNGDGTFQSAVNYSTAGQTWAGGVGDFNGDGKTDIAALGSAGLSVFINSGDGTFQAGMTYGAGSGTSGLAIADLDGDGKPDIGVSNIAPRSSPPFLQNGTVSILLNGQFALVGLDSSTNPSDAGKPVTFTGRAKPAFPGTLVPSGTVTLQDAKSVIGNATLTNGTATIPPVSLTAGTHHIIVRYGGDRNFRPGSSGVLQVVNAPDFSVASSGAKPVSVTPGQSANATVTVASVGAFSGSVSLSCSVSPTPALAPRCSLNPDSVQVGNDNSITSTLTLATTGATVAASRPGFPPSPRWMFALWLPVPAIILAGWLTNRPRRKKWLHGILLGCVLTSAIGLQMGCGGGTQQTGSGSTPPGNYSITVQGMSGVTKHTVSVSLTVQ